MGLRWNGCSVENTLRGVVADIDGYCLGFCRSLGLDCVRETFALPLLPSFFFFDVHFLSFPLSLASHLSRQLLPHPTC